MRYELRTRFTLSSADPMQEDGMGSADRLLQWLYEYTAHEGNARRPTWRRHDGWATATPSERSSSSWSRSTGMCSPSRRTGLRIEEALGRPAGHGWRLPSSVGFEVMRVYGDAELVDLADPTKKATHPC